MSEARLTYIIRNELELNFSYMPFIIEGGLFIPTSEAFNLGENVTIDLQLPNQLEPQRVEGKVIWITPKNSLYQILPGIGVEFVGDKVKSIRDQIKANLDTTMDMGAYVCGMSTEIDEPSKRKK